MSRSEMTKWLTILATTVALVAPAAAGSPTIPKEYRGKWCQGGLPYYTPERLITKRDAEFGCGKYGSGWITITEKEYVSGGALCRLVKILSSRGRGDHVMQFRCDGPEVEDTATQVFHFAITDSSGSHIPNARLYIEEDVTVTELPPEMLGTWCAHEGHHEPGEMVYTKFNCYGNPSVGDQVIMIEPNGLKDGGVTACEDASIIRRENIYTVRFRCRDDFNVFDQTAEMYMLPEDMLFVRWGKMKYGRRQ